MAQTLPLRELVKDVALRLAGKTDRAIRQLELTYGGRKRLDGGAAAGAKRTGASCPGSGLPTPGPPVRASFPSDVFSPASRASTSSESPSRATRPQFLLEGRDPRRRAGRERGAPAPARARPRARTRRRGVARRVGQGRDERNRAVERAPSHERGELLPWGSCARASRRRSTSVWLEVVAGDPAGGYVQAGSWRLKVRPAQDSAAWVARLVAAQAWSAPTRRPVGCAAPSVLDWPGPIVAQALASQTNRNSRTSNVRVLRSEPLHCTRIGL